MRDQLEKRISPRRNTNIHARIVVGGNQADCVVRNVSDTGAKLEVGSVSQIPNTLALVVPGHQPQQCRVVWRRLREIGVAFTG